MLFPQKQEEEENNATVGTVDVENDEVIRLVTNAVTAITTRLQSKGLSGGGEGEVKARGQV